MSNYVKPSKDMDDETFVKHFFARHMPLAGMQGLQSTSARMNGSVVETMRAYHKRVHRAGEEDDPPNRRPVNHEHRSKAKTPPEPTE